MPEERSERMTLADKQRLEDELAELEGPRRAAVVQAIATARGFGDLSENFEYHAAKNEQGLLERRIRVLRDRLNRAELVDEAAASASDAVEVGSRVEIEDEQGERMTMEISSVGGVSADSPAGRALIGAKVGDEVQIDAPRGAWRARIISIER
jgi:transcription elongation factor GreA